jgi:hypothetical protein
VVISNDEEALVFILQANAILKRAHEVAKMKLASWPITRQNTLSHACRPTSTL